MMWMVRELRDKTGLSQRAFAEEYHIPLSTLRKWEQGEASPSPYVIELLARTIPGTDRGSERIIYKDEVYYCSEAEHTVSDAQGNVIRVKADFEPVNRQNLGLYLHDLYADFYESRKRFERDCELDPKEQILWSELDE